MTQIRTCALAGQIPSVDMTIADFDGTMYHISSEGGDTSKIRVSISVPFFYQLQEFDVDAVSVCMYVCVSALSATLFAITLPLPPFSLSTSLDFSRPLPLPRPLSTSLDLSRPLSTSLSLSTSCFCCWRHRCALNMVLLVLNALLPVMASH